MLSTAADEPDPRARRRRPGIAVCEAGVILADLHEAALAAGRRFPLTLGAQGLGDDRRPRLDQCRRHPGAALRHDARAGARDRGGAARRQPVRGAGRAQEGQSRLRSQAVADRRRRDARHRHRGEPASWCPRSASAPSPGSGSSRPQAAMALLRQLEAAHRRGDRELRAGAEERARPGARACSGHARAARRRRRRGTCWSRRSRRWRRRARSACSTKALRSALETGLVARRGDRRERGAGRGLLAAARFDLGGREEGRPGRQARHLGPGRATWPAS